MINKCWLTLIISVAFLPGRAQQSSLKVMAEVPVQFGLGYEARLSSHFSVAFSAGVTHTTQQ